MAPTWLYLIGKGIGMGVVHVLTGPDHLSALATLSANGGVTSLKYGIRWGIGHSTGLLIVGTTMIAMSSGENKIDFPDSVNNSLEAFVGIFMILFGSYSIFNISKRRRQQYNISLNGLADEEGQKEESLGMEVEMQRFTITNKDSEDVAYNDVPLHSGFIKEEPSHCGQLFMNLFCPLRICQTGVNGYMKCFSSIKVSKQVLALCIGIVHGVAGPGGVLGVIPAVNLRDWKLAIIYLCYFCCSSTIVMGLYALVYGIISVRLSYATNLGYQIELFSASLSILVGVLWLLLLAIGRLVP